MKEEMKEELIQLIKQISTDTINFYIKKIDENKKSFLLLDRAELRETVMQCIINISGNMIAGMYNLIKVNTTEEERIIFIQAINELYIKGLRNYFDLRLKEKERH